MADDKLRIYEAPSFKNPRLVMGFTGWMDGGDVSTGTIRILADRLNGRRFAEILPQGFYIYNFPGAMELTAMFRPHCKIREGQIRTFDFPENVFYCDPENDLVLFLGKEPNLAWEEYADCIFDLCSAFGIGTIYFIGSVSGLVPHTREPHFHCSVSNGDMKSLFERYGVGFSDYEGPASIVTYLTTQARDRNVNMVSLVATVPAYVQGNNPKCIDAVARRLAGILGVDVSLDDLREAADDFERKLTDVVNEQPELAESVIKLEQDYDNEIFDNEMTDLKQWLHQKGIRLD